MYEEMHMNLTIGTTLFLEPTYTERVERFRCRVVEMTDEHLFIDYPVNTVTKKTAFLVDGTQFRGTFTDDKKISFAFNTEVIGRRGGNVPTIILKRPQTPEEFIKIQRREYVRVETPVDVAVTTMEDMRHQQFVTEDISAGGVALKLREKPSFNEAEEITVTLVLPFVSGEICYITTEAIVVRIFERDALKLASIQFTDTDDVDKQHLVRFCFERQLEARKREVDLF